MCWLCFVIFGISQRDLLPTTSIFDGSSKNPTNRIGIYHLHQLLSLSPDELEKVDIALMNLVCAQGLKGSENLDIDVCLSTLDEWTQKVKTDTEARLYNFHQNPAKYDHSEAVFRMINLVLTLKDDLGIHYNVSVANNWEFSDSKDIL